MPPLVALDADVDFGAAKLSAFFGQDKIVIFAVGAGHQVEAHAGFGLLGEAELLLLLVELGQFFLVFLL